jgi:hypothetical protein
MYFNTTYSSYDGGWYSEVWDAQGKDQWQSPVYPTEEEASAAAKKWIAEKGYRPNKRNPF